MANRYKIIFSPCVGLPPAMPDPGLTVVDCALDFTDQIVSYPATIPPQGGSGDGWQKALVAYANGTLFQGSETLSVDPAAPVYYAYTYAPRTGAIGDVYAPGASPDAGDSQMRMATFDHGDGDISVIYVGDGDTDAERVKVFVFNTTTGFSGPIAPPDYSLSALSEARDVIFHPSGNFVFLFYRSGASANAVFAVEYDKLTGLGAVVGAPYSVVAPSSAYVGRQIAMEPDDNTVFMVANSGGVKSLTALPFDTVTGFGAPVAQVLPISATARDYRVFCSAGAGGVLVAFSDPFAVAPFIGVIGYPFNGGLVPSFGAQYADPGIPYPSGNFYFKTAVFSPANDFVVTYATEGDGLNSNYQVYSWSDTTGFGPDWFEIGAVNTINQDIGLNLIVEYNPVTPVTRNVPNGLVIVANYNWPVTFMPNNNDKFIKRK